MSSVQITFTGEDRDLLQAFQRQQGEILKNQRALLRMGEISKGATDDTEKGLKKATIAAEIFHQGIGVVRQGLIAWRDANTEIIRQADEAGAKYDEIFRKFRVQSGLRGIEADRAQQRIVATSAQFSVPVEQGEAVARQLVSSGFAPDQATGESLKEVLRVLAAANIRGDNLDPTDLTASISKYLISQGLDLNAQNLATVGRSSQILFRGTNLQIPNLQNLAKEGAGFAGAVSPQDQLATFSMLSDAFEGPEAAVGLRNVVGRLRTARETPTRVKALERLGLKPEDVDLVGEDLFTSLESLNRGLTALPEEQRAGTLKLLFEEQGVAPAQVMLSNVAELRRRRAMLNDQSGFMADVEEATSGRNAARVRQDVLRENRRAAADQQDNLINQELDLVLEELGVSAAQRGFATSPIGYRGARGLGFSPETAVGLQLPIGSDVSATDVLQRVQQRQQSASDQSALINALEKNSRATEANTRSSGPPPTAGMSRSN